MSDPQPPSATAAASPGVEPEAQLVATARPNQQRANDLLIEQTKFLAGLATVLVPLSGGFLMQSSWTAREELLLQIVLTLLAGVVVSGFIQLAVSRKYFTMVAKQEYPDYEPVLRLVADQPLGGRVFQWNGEFVRREHGHSKVAFMVQQTLAFTALLAFLFLMLSH